MRILSASNYRRMPWKNGGGETVEIAISPDGAGIDDFDWRLSMARVESSGPFSTFQGVDRTLAILDGKGIFLHVDGRIPFGLTEKSDPLPFPADVPTRADLIAGPITDLNMMTRRGKAVHSMRRVIVSATSNLAVEVDEILLFCRSGAVRIGDDDALRLAPLDTLHVRAAASDTLRIKADKPAELFLIEIAKAA